MGDRDVLIFIFSLACLLTLARAFGEVARRVGLPLVVGEILAGLFLGPTVLGRLAPSAQQWLFSAGAPAHMLRGYTTVAVVLLLVVAGLEVDLSIVRRQGRSAVFTSAFGMFLPLLGGVALGFFLPDSNLVNPDRRWLFATFIGVALSISALPVIAKTLLDLGLFKTDIGLLVMATATIDDLAGWLAFTVLLGPVSGHGLDASSVARTVGLAVAFLAVAFYVGRPAIERLLTKLQQNANTGPRNVLSFVLLLALFGASFTEAIGIHALFGGFIVGVIVGDSPQLREHTRANINDFVTTLFAPVFFASLGLRVDFSRAFDLRLCALVLVVATLAKVVGCTAGARLAGVKWRPAAAVGCGLNSRGAMEIILALVALDAGLIREQIFVALVVMALGTSLMSGPSMKWFLRHTEEVNLTSLVRAGGFVSALEAATASGAIRELVKSLHASLGKLDVTALHAVLEREAIAPTGLGEDVAIPHAAIEGIKTPLLALGRSKQGIDFDAPDGSPAKIVLLLLMPPKAYDDEVRILASIARALIRPETRERLLAAPDIDELVRLLAPPSPSNSRDERTSFADI